MMDLPQIKFEGDGTGGGSGDGTGEPAPGGDKTPKTYALTDVLPEDLAGSPSLKKFENPEALAKSYLELESSRQHYLRIPGEDAGDEQINEFYEQITQKVPGLMRTPSDDPEVMHQIHRQLGAPEDADGYKVPEIDDQGVQLDMGMVDLFRGVAAKNGLTQSQFQNIVEEITNTNVQNALESRRQLDADRSALVGEWGNAYDTRMQQITNFARNTGAPQMLIDAINSGQLGAGTARWLHKIVAQTAGEGGELTRTPSGDTLLTVTQAKEQISEIMNNKQHPYWNPQMHGHAEAKKKMQDLYKQAHPGGTDNIGTVGVGSQIEFN